MKRKKRIITQNDLMMFIIVNDLLEEYRKEPYNILFDFNNGKESELIGFMAFTMSEPNNTRYQYTGLEVDSINNVTSCIFHFRKI